MSKWGGFLKDIEMFDPAYFGISPELGRVTDPLVRQWLEVSSEALADAGFGKKRLWGQKVGVFAGSRTANFIHKANNLPKDFLVGSAQNFITAYLAHIYNFTGPNMVVDTACSSSITAIHLAIQSLHNNESVVALAGGVDILLDEKPFVSLSTAQVLSPDGRSKTFDESANGTGIGEGCGVLVLKKRSAAIKDGNKIYGIIEGSSVNNDGNTMGVTTPNPKAQQLLIEETLNKANIHPHSITYVETHGTGTAIGDPIELRGITQALRLETPNHCGVGSVKSNIGHLLSASGVASVMKVLLSMTAGQLPPTLNCNKPNPRFDFRNAPVYPVRKLTDWNGVEGVLRAGVSAFGLGGSNGHLILSNQGIPGQAKVKMPLEVVKIDYNKSRYWPKTENSAPEPRQIEKEFDAFFNFFEASPNSKE